MSDNKTPFLLNFSAWAENPWIAAKSLSQKRGSSGLVTLELCAGGGGQALGLETAGIDHAGLVEIDGTSCATLSLNRPRWNVINADLNNLDAAPFVGVGIVSGGLPRPPFSVAGKQLGNNDERNLFPAMISPRGDGSPRILAGAF
jgi:DNA (cytosine-5)-methyltransferase 1